MTGVAASKFDDGAPEQAEPVGETNPVRLGALITIEGR